MILVRDVFQVKYGKMKDAKEIWKQMFKISPVRRRLPSNSAWTMQAYSLTVFG